MSVETAQEKIDAGADLFNNHWTYIYGLTGEKLVCGELRYL
jgi:hypothetical protein